MPNPPEWLTAAVAEHRGRERCAQAQTALRPFLSRPHALPKARALDIACPRSHRLAQVLRTPDGLVYVARQIVDVHYDAKELDPFEPDEDFPNARDPHQDLYSSGHIEDEGGVPILTTRRIRRTAVVDFLVVPTMFAPESPDALPAQCSCQSWWLSAATLLAMVPARSSRSRVIATDALLLDG
ncbi:hypothetical protein [Pedococcus soli]